MNDNTALQLLIHIRQQLLQPRYDSGELQGFLVLTPPLAEQLKTLAVQGLTENVVLINNAYLALDKVLAAGIGNATIPVVIYTRNLRNATYYETWNEFLKNNPYQFPTGVFYIRELHFTNTDASVPVAIEQYKNLLQLIILLTVVADYVIEAIGEPKELVFFAKRKLSMFINYSQNDVRSIPFLEALTTQLTEAHDKEERKSIFTAELVAALLPSPPDERFGKLLTSVDVVYDNYLKSHLLYLEKFSYHDLKSKVDKDKLDYTKKIYATVNDIQSKLIAVPAAFLLVLAQFDFANKWSYKNILIGVGAFLFSVLLEVLLRNQFGVLRYVETEILQFKNELSNSQTSIDLSGFTKSFAHLQSIATRQHIYLWIFRVIVWSVPVTAIILFLCK